MNLRELNNQLVQGIALLEMKRGLYKGQLDLDWSDEDGNQWALKIDYTISVDPHYGSDMDGRRGILNIELDDWKVTKARLLSDSDEPIKFSLSTLSKSDIDDLRSVIYNKAVGSEFF